MSLFAFRSAPDTVTQQLSASQLLGYSIDSSKFWTTSKSVSFHISPLHSISTSFISEFMSPRNCSCHIAIMDVSKSRLCKYGWTHVLDRKPKHPARRAKLLRLWSFDSHLCMSFPEIAIANIISNHTRYRTQLVLSFHLIICVTIYYQ